MRRRKDAFTLIELIAVLVILAILALIVTPLVLNIVKKSKDSANKRSVDGYGRAVELAVATYLLENNKYPTCESDLKIEYTGNEVACNIMKLNENGGLYLSECKVGNSEVKDSKTADGWYHYGKVDNSLEDIIDNNYKIGDIVTYNGMDFYVIADSDENSDFVTLLKAEPLTVDEVNKYGKDHINRYTEYSVGTAYNKNGYGGMTYYSRETCGYVNGSRVETGCTIAYEQSEVKYVVDVWTQDKFKSSDLAVDTTGYSTRLITYDELFNNLSYHVNPIGLTWLELDSEYTPSWVYNKNYRYWTMSPNNDSTLHMWSVGTNGDLGSNDVYKGYYDVVRPVINLYKSAIGKTSLQESNIINLKCD